MVRIEMCDPKTPEDSYSEIVSGCEGVKTLSVELKNALETLKEKVSELYAMTMWTDLEKVSEAIALTEAIESMVEEIGKDTLQAKEEYSRAERKAAEAFK